MSSDINESKSPSSEEVVKPNDEVKESSEKKVDGKPSDEVKETSENKMDGKPSDEVKESSNSNDSSNESREKQSIRQILKDVHQESNPAESSESEKTRGGKCL